MARYHLINGKRIAFTAEEEAAEIKKKQTQLLKYQLKNIKLIEQEMVLQLIQK